MDCGGDRGTGPKTSPSVVGRRGEDAFDLKEEEDMPFSCEEYREQQQLLALKKRLAEDELRPEDREELEKLVQELERKLKI